MPETSTAPQNPPSSSWRVPDIVMVVMLAVLLFRGDVSPGPNPGPGPDPGPQPGPVDPTPPGPKPDPNVKKLPKGSFLVVVEATEDRSKFPYLASLQKDVSFWRGLTAKGYFSAFLDSEEDEAKKYQKDWEAVGLPCFLGISPEGDVVVAIPCPPETSFMEQYLLP